VHPSDWIALAIGSGLVVLTVGTLAISSDALVVNENLCFAQECNEPGVHYRTRPCVGATIYTHSYDYARGLCMGIPIGSPTCTGFPDPSVLEETRMPCPKP
jgi:hypothetical protein